jgi:hypothetical protein
MDFLLALIEGETRQATAAIEAIGRIAPNAELRVRVEKAVQQTGSPRLAQALQEHLPPRDE